MRLIRFTLALGIIGLLSSISPSQAAIRVQYKVKVDSSGVESKTLIGGYDTIQTSMQEGAKNGKLLRRLPYYIGHRPEDLNYDFEEWEFSSLESAPRYVQSFLRNQALKTMELDQTLENYELRVIREQGPKENRINLTVLGDGYTLAEKERFFEDVEWMVRGLFETPTFESYLPLFNVYAVYAPSNVSGIGDGSPRDTAFRLYRDPAGSKRGIMPGDESALTRAMRVAPATDYPIVLANDDYYGGLGGRWAISTRSRSSGLIVLRHELGHNFGEVGEEYDNGYVYRGANASSSTRVPWAHWMDSSTVSVNEAKLLAGDYVWKNLSSGAYRASFQTAANTGSLVLDLSSVGWSAPSEVSVRLNGEEVALDGIFHNDRSFFTIHKEGVRPSQSYSLEIKEEVADGDNVLGFALAYAMPANYDFTPNKVGAFASYNNRGSKSYRPTHNSCLMKDMRRLNFCPVDQENMWLKFLGRVSLIDDITVSMLADGSQRVRVESQELGDNLKIDWKFCSGDRSGQCVALSEHTNEREWILSPAAPKGNYEVSVSFQSPEVRLQSRELSDSKRFVVR